MTKTEAKNLGTDAGIAFANTRSTNELLQDLDAHRVDIKDRAIFEALNNGGFRTVDSPNAIAFIDAFISACGSRFIGRRNELPEVKAQQLVRWTTRHIERELEGAKATCAQFADEFAKNPSYAFRWAERAMTAAATLDVYARIQYGLTHDGDNVVDVTAEAIVTMHAECTREALRGARNPSRSTSQVSNVMEDAKTSAMAEFVDYVGTAIKNGMVL